MANRIIVDPVTRIEGHLRVEAILDGNGAIGGVVNVVPRKPNPYSREGSARVALGALALFLGEPLTGVALETSLSEAPNLAHLAAREHQTLEKEQQLQDAQHQLRHPQQRRGTPAACHSAAGRRATHPGLP